MIHPNSIATYRSIEGSLPTIREKVYRVIELCGPLTTFEIETITGGLHQTISARVKELKDEGRVIEVGSVLNERNKPTAVLDVAPQGLFW